MGSHEDTVRTLETELAQVEHPDPRLPLIG
jgi:hypothetical protein